MKTKHKIAIIGIIAVLALSLIGVSIALVLVAQQATTNNSMTVSYTANNVNATITASGKNYATIEAATGEDILLSDDSTSKSVTFNAADTDEEVAAKGENAVSFKNTNLTASGEAVYTFSIQNTANAANTSVLKLVATFSDMKEGDEDDNITIKVGSTRATALTAVTLEDNTYFTEIGAGQVIGQFVVVMRVTDATLNVDDFNLKMNIKLGYDVFAPSISPLVTVNNPQLKPFKIDDYDSTIDGTTKTFYVEPFISTEPDPFNFYFDLEDGDWVTEDMVTPEEDRINYTGYINWCISPVQPTGVDDLYYLRDYTIKIDLIMPDGTTYTRTKQPTIDLHSITISINADWEGGDGEHIDLLSALVLNAPDVWKKGMQVIITIIS